MKEYRKNLYLAMLVCRNKLSKQDYFYTIVGPMLGTLENGIFIDSHDKKYHKMTDRIMQCTKNRFAYYNLISLYDFMHYYVGEKPLEEVIKDYVDFHKNTTYYVYLEKTKGHFVLPFDYEKARDLFSNK